MKDFITRCFTDYLKATYGSNENLWPLHMGELETAYLSGMHELNRFILHSEPLREALEERLTELGCLQKGSELERDNH